MKISVNAGTADKWSGDLLIIGILEGQLDNPLNLLEERFGKQSKDCFERNKFSGKKNESLTFHLLDRNPEKVICVGLGKPEELLLTDFQKAAALGARSSLGSAGKLGVLFPWDLFRTEEAAAAVAEAIRLSFFKDQRFRGKPDVQTTPDELVLLGISDSISPVLETINPICSGVELARELVGAPPNELTPAGLAQTATKIAQQFGLDLKVLEKEDCEKLGMGAYLAVSQGSDLAPKFIHLTYKSKSKPKRKLAIIGKGLTFDSGGYNLKVGASQIELMKFDMGGSAAALGAARAISELRPSDVEVHFIVAACENMINGSAVHPGDIIKASNGKTIEINNTDAEGRLTLADALVYACKLKPDSIVDLATLTGACVIALGDEIAGLWSNNDRLAQDLISSARNAGEEIWRMPMPNSYKDGLKSMFADLKNTGPRAGGSITAALFLEEFLEESTPWAHIDIAGTVWSDKDKGVNPAGATGYGVRTLVKWVTQQN